MTVMSEGLLLNSKYTKNGSLGEGFSSFPHTATPCNCLQCGLKIIHLRLCDREKSLGARRLRLKQTDRTCWTIQTHSSLLACSPFVARERASESDYLRLPQMESLLSRLAIGSPESGQPTGSQIIRICTKIYLKIDKTVKMYQNSYQSIHTS